MKGTLAEVIRARDVVALAMVTALCLGACVSKPAASEKLVAARVAVQRTAALVDVTGAVKVDRDLAQGNLDRAEAARKSGREPREVDQLAYIAEQSAMAAIERHEAMQLRKNMAPGEGERSAAEREAREREATMALHKAETAEMEAARVQQLAR